MAQITITSDTASLFSHEVHFVIYPEDTTGATYSVRLLDMGNLKYEFDIPDSGDDATKVGVRSGALDVTFENFYTDSSDTLIDTLSSSFLFTGAVFPGKSGWPCDMYYREKGGSYGEPIRFNFTHEDVEYDPESETVKMSLQPWNFKLFARADETTGDPEFTVKQFFTSFDADLDSYRFDYGSVVTDSIISGEFIRQFMWRAQQRTGGSWPPTLEPIIYSDNFTDGAPASGDEWFVVEAWADDASDTTLEDNTTPIDQCIGIMAAVDGAIYGAALGQTFYVGRNRTDAALQVELNWDNVVKFNKAPFQNPKYSLVTVVYRGLSKGIYSILPAQEKNLTISFDDDAFAFGTISGAPNGGDGAADVSAGGQGLVDTGAENYAKAFGIDTFLKAGVEYWGIDGIYPYSVITFDVNAPSVYQSKNFRIKSIDYNFKLDKVSMQIYQI